MSDVETLTTENTNLKAQLENAINQANAYCAEIDAVKGMLSDTIQSYINLSKTNILLRQTNEKLAMQRTPDPAL